MWLAGERGEYDIREKDIVGWRPGRSVLIVRRG